MSTTAADVDVLRRIESSRKDLLDLSAHNRLISAPRVRGQGKSRSSTRARKRSFESSCVNTRRCRSYPVKAKLRRWSPAYCSLNRPQLEQPEDESTLGGPPPSHHLDLRLQTRMVSQRLQDRLLDIYYDAETYEQEQVRASRTWPGRPRIVRVAIPQTRPGGGIHHCCSYPRPLSGLPLPAAST